MTHRKPSRLPARTDPRESMATAPRKEKLLVVTVVWGDWHIRKFLDLNLPTLLADGNFPALARLCDLTYVIYTSQADMRRLREAPELQALAGMMKLEFRRIKDEEMKDPMVAHHAIWSEAANRARSQDSFILLMPPDVVWSNGSFAHVGRLLESGKQAIFMSYLRAESEAFAARLAREFKNDMGAIALSGSELVELCLTTLHPLMAAYLRDSTQFPVHPEMLLWAVPNEGLLCRAFSREMFVYDPAYLQLNTANLLETPIDPSLVHMVRDSDDLFAVSLAPLDKEFDWYRSPSSADPASIGEWWLNYDSWVNDLVATTKLRWHSRPVTEESWRAKERSADLFVRRAAALREGRRLFRAARELHCDAAAHLLAVAVHTRVMPQAARGRGGALVFLPTDRALQERGSGFLEGLQATSAARELVREMRAHFVPNADAVHATPLGESEGRNANLRYVAADGSPLTIARDGATWRVNGTRVVAGPKTAGKNIVYAIDSLLTEVKAPSQK